MVNSEFMFIKYHAIFSLKNKKAYLLLTVKSLEESNFRDLTRYL